MRPALRHRSLRMFCCFLVIVSFILPTSSTHPIIMHAAGTDVPHCTDWPEASIHQGANAEDKAISDYEAFTIISEKVGHGQLEHSYLSKRYLTVRTLIGEHLCVLINHLLYSTLMI